MHYAKNYSCWGLIVINLVPLLEWIKLNICKWFDPF